jgi:hypothetical protein
MLSSSSLLKNKEVLIYLDGGKLKEVGQLFWNPLWQLLSPLNMALVCGSSYSWVICFHLSHIDSMCHPNFSFQSKSALIFCHIFVLGTPRVNAAKSDVVPHYVQGKFHFKTSICSITSFHFPYQSILI